MISALPRTLIAAVSPVNWAMSTSPASSRSEWWDRVSLPRVRPMITTPSSSALTTMYRLLGSSSSVTVPPSIAAPTIPIGLRLRPDRLQPRRLLADQLVDLSRERRTGEDMITIGIYDDLTAADDDMKHDFVGPRMPRENRFETVRKPGVTIRNPNVDELAPRHRDTVRVVPQPRHVGHDRRRLDLGLDLRFGRRNHRAARA